MHQMNMADRQDRHNGDEAISRDATDQASKTKIPSALATNPELTKHWAKYYRTSIASGMSIMLSQTVSVSSLVSRLIAIILIAV